MWVVLLDIKAAATDAIKLLRRSAAASFGCYAPTTVAEFMAYCAGEGIQRHFSALFTPQQNDVVERRNQMVVATTHALLKQRGMLAIYKGEAVMTDVHLLNPRPPRPLTARHHTRPGTGASQW
jgi:hypothetical protein